ncbi:hypothetical protein ABNE08_21180 [Paenibacillus larvae]
MSYTIKSTEKTKAKGSEFETKALLYLMNFRKDSNEVHYFVIDFFNDLTGFDRYTNKAWDLQSKGAKDNHQSAIGKELVTLYKNYVSTFSFEHYILFLGGVSEKILVDKTKKIFDISNFSDKAQTKIADSLLNECKSKSYIEDSKINLRVINEFLKHVLFVVDDKEKSEYVKTIIKVNPSILPSNTILEQIFNEIRDVQSSKKNNNNVEGITIHSRDEFLYYNRYLKVDEIRMMALSRIINYGLIEKGVPPSFIDIYTRFNEIERKDMLEDCKLNIYKTLFDKNNSKNFWNFFNDVYNILTQEPKIKIDDAYKLLNKDVLGELTFLDLLSVKYFLAIIKDGMYEN